jgi:hypothetical protein
VLTSLAWVLLLLIQVQAALMDVSQSPWKVMKYMFNRKVMSALKVCNIYS